MVPRWSSKCLGGGRGRGGIMDLALPRCPHAQKQKKNLPYDPGRGASKTITHARPSEFCNCLTNQWAHPGFFGPFTSFGRVGPFQHAAFDVTLAHDLKLPQNAPKMALQHFVVWRNQHLGKQVCVSQHQKHQTSRHQQNNKLLLHYRISQHYNHDTPRAPLTCQLEVASSAWPTWRNLTIKSLGLRLWVSPPCDPTYQQGLQINPAPWRNWKSRNFNKSQILGF